MAIEKIEFEDKITEQASPLAANKKATAEDYNEIKNVVNSNADVLETLSSPKYISPPVGNTTNLKTIITVGVAFATLTYNESGTNNTKVYTLITGGDAESLPEIVRPDDWEAVVNEKFWRLGNAASGASEETLYLSSSNNQPTSGHVTLNGPQTINGTKLVQDPDTLSLLWFIDYGSGFNLANGTGTLAGLKSDLEANLLLASDKAKVNYNATPQVAYEGDMVNGFLRIKL